MRNQIEFIADAAHTVAHLHVNGVKTNIWHWLPNYEFYENDIQGTIAHWERCQDIAYLIAAGYITADNWERWDTSAHTIFHISEVVPIDKKTRIRSSNHIEECIGYEDFTSPEKQRDCIKKYIGKAISVQWNKRFYDRLQISQKVGITFYQYGYTLAFINNH